MCIERDKWSKILRVEEIECIILASTVINALRQNTWRCLFQDVGSQTTGSCVSGRGPHGWHPLQGHPGEHHRLGSEGSR